MPATCFLCPDSRAVTFAECLASCRLGSRCLSKRTLRMVAEQREWRGEPSTTQLLKGTREAYLEIVADYAVDPMGELFRVLGSKAHAYLEEFTDNELSEERLHDDIGSGQFDFYDPEEQILVDTKTWGSFKVARALGYTTESYEVPTGEVYKTGEKKGQPKMKKQSRTIKGEPDMIDTEYQLNHYRMMLEDAGFPVKSMFVEAIVRDGGTYIAKNRGINQNGYLIPVKRLENNAVKSYLAGKAFELINALNNNILPPRCSDDENWNGRKCAGFCRVAGYCDHPQAAATTDEEA